MPREEQQSVNRNSSINVSGSNSTVQSNPSRTKKIFVGGLASTVTESDFRMYFGQFGTITDVVVMYDHGTQRPRGFGFITYDSEDAVDRVLQRTFHELNEKMVEVKRAVPKDSSSPSPNRNNVGLTSGSVRSGNYTSGYGHTFSTSPISSYAMRMDGRFSPSPSNNRTASYLPYGSIGYVNNANHSSPSINGMQNLATYGSGGYYRSGGFGGSSTGSNGVYGSVGSGFGNNNQVSYGNSPGRNLWSTGGNSYGSIGNPGGFVASSGLNLNSYNSISTWASSPSQTNSSGLYDNQNYGSSYGSGDGAFISSNSSRYERQNSGYGSLAGDLGGSRWGSGSNASFGNIYGSSGYNDSTWRVTPADALNSARSGSGGFHFDFDNGNGSEEILSTTDEGYGASGRQSYRGIYLFYLTCQFCCGMPVVFLYKMLSSLKEIRGMIGK